MQVGCLGYLQGHSHCDNPSGFVQHQPPMVDEVPFQNHLAPRTSRVCNHWAHRFPHDHYTPEKNRVKFFSNPFFLGVTHLGEQIRCENSGTLVFEEFLLEIISCRFCLDFVKMDFGTRTSWDGQKSSQMLEKFPQVQAKPRYWYDVMVATVSSENYAVVFFLEFPTTMSYTQGG